MQALRLTSCEKQTRKAVAAAFLSLDVAMQALGGLEKNPPGFFEQGGWFSANRDDRTGEVMETVVPFLKGRLPPEIKANRQAPPPLF